MIILFSPSENKKRGGKSKKFDANSFIFPQLFKKRVEVLNLYNDYIRQADKKALSKLFGLKDEKMLEYYSTDIFNRPVMKAIERYEGVAYGYLKYSSLPNNAQKYIDKNVLIFSNLFGTVLAKDELIDYKLKQGEKIDSFATEKFYKEHFSKTIDEYLQKHTPIIDLRAGFYEKFYRIKEDFITMKFIKNAKVVSHWAKAYRGIVLKLMALNEIQSTEELEAMEIENLRIKEIRKIKNKTEFVYEITS